MGLMGLPDLVALVGLVGKIICLILVQPYFFVFVGTNIKEHKSRFWIGRVRSHDKGNDLKIS